MDRPSIPALVCATGGTLLGAGVGAGTVGMLSYAGSGLTSGIIGGVFGGLIGGGVAGMSAAKCIDESRAARRRRIAALPLRQMPIGIANPMTAQPSSDLTRVESWDRRNFRRV